MPVVIKKEIWMVSKPDNSLYNAEVVVEKNTYEKYHKDTSVRKLKQHEAYKRYYNEHREEMKEYYKKYYHERRYNPDYYCEECQKTIKWCSVIPHLNTITHINNYIDRHTS